MPLVSLPLDILLAILRDLDIVDVVHTGMVSPLKVAVLARTDTERHRLAKTSVGPYKTVTSGWINSKSCVENTRCSDLPRLRWNKGDNENGSVAKGLLGISGVRKLLLLPGGKTVLVISDYGSVSLCQIELKDGRASAYCGELQVRPKGYFRAQVEQITYRHVALPNSRSQARGRVRLPLLPCPTSLANAAERIQHAFCQSRPPQRCHEFGGHVPYT